jgi:inorganic pyrophosphatase
MDLNKIPAGRNPPYEVNVVIEVPLGGQPVKYELDKASGAIFVDRFLHTAMIYLSRQLRLHPPYPGGRRRSHGRPGGRPDARGARGGGARPAGRRAVDGGRSRRRRKGAGGAGRRPPPVLFTHYKDLEPEKWVRVDRWGEAEEALKLIETAIEQDQG